MGKYLGADITVTLDGNSVGNLVSFTPPAEEYDRIDFTGLSDSYPDTKLADIPNASEFGLLVDFDRSDATQATIEGLVGVDTSIAMVITYPWASNNTYTQNVKVFGATEGEISKKGRVQRTLNCVTTGAGAWSTV